MPRDAEEWLAARGVRREPVTSPAPADVTPAPPAAANDGASTASARPVPPAAAGDEAPPATSDAVETSPLDEDVAAALAFVQHSTAAAPQSVGRVRAKLAGRGWSPDVIERALEEAKTRRLLDDRTLAAALVAERREKGHALPRLRADLRARGFTREVIDEVLRPAEREDPEAAAFALARERAAALSGVAPETALRRIVGFLARRGYPEPLARKVARAAVFADRETQRTAGR